MKAQWQLVNIETGEVLAKWGDSFYFTPAWEWIVKEWERQYRGTGTGQPPVGVLMGLPIIESDDPELRKADKEIIFGGAPK